MIGKLKIRLPFLWEIWTDPGALMRYVDDTGYGYRPVAYSPFSDEVCVRISRFGYIVQDVHWLPRENFLKLGKLLKD